MFKPASWAWRIDWGERGDAKAALLAQVSRLRAWDEKWGNR